MTNFQYKELPAGLTQDMLLDIGRTHGTPAYIYTTGAIEKQYRHFNDTFARLLPADRQPMICYACKANSHLSVLNYLRHLGSSLEVVSGGELQRAIKAGFEGKQIIFTGVGKTEAEIELGLKHEIFQFNAESVEEIFKINEVAARIGRTAPIVLRYNPDVSGGGHDKISTGRERDKFGLGRSGILKAFETVKDLPHINLCGLSVHIGSQVFTVESFEQAFAKFPKLVEELRGAGHKIERLDIGGGFPIRYQDENLLDLARYAEWVRDIILPLNTHIAVEPGRYMVGNAGLLLTKVLYVKETQTVDFVIIDAAMNDLIRPTLYEAYHHIQPLSTDKEVETAKPRNIVGPICESGDTFAHHRALPDVKPEEYLTILSTGAYGKCMASNYNTRGMAAEILVHNGEATLITPRQSVEELLEKEALLQFS
jgi:diaminopimelate decarboxylase